MEVSSHRRDDLFTQSPAPLPSQRVGGVSEGGAQSSKLLSVALVLLVTGPHAKATQEPIKNG